jgi:predicted DNA-binding transcriptional regulator AlpA
MNTLDQREATAALRQDELPDLLDCDAVCAFFGGIHHSTLYRGIRKGWYPPPIKVGPNTSRWFRSECWEAFYTMCPAARERAGQ